MRLCNLEQCNDKHYGQGYCSKHYWRWKRYGSPDTVRIARTYEETLALRTKQVGDCLIWTGSVDERGYGKLGRGGKALRAHRYVWEKEVGAIPEGMQLDHLCHNTSCVNIKHLRIATDQQNAENRDQDKVRSASGYMGVYIRKSGRWIAHLGHKGKVIHVGTFDTAEEASAARAAKRAELYEPAPQIEGA